MFELKPLPAAGVPAALERARHYRLLNEPREAESICRDILRTDPKNQDAIVTLILALTDQFDKRMRVNVGHAQELLPRITSDYQRTYYGGMICERWGKAQMDEGAPGHVLYDWFRKAMDLFNEAEGMAGEDADPILRYNACARIVKRNDEIRPLPEDNDMDAMLQDDVPV